MARRRRSDRARQRRRPQRPPRLATTRSYRSGLQDAIAKWLPSPFFSRWRVAAGSKWSPLRLVWMALLMAWGAEPSLQARFAAGRAVLRSLFPKWPLGKTYSGWYEAQLTWLTPLRPALTKRLQGQLPGLAGRHWHREGWCAFAVDGSRVDCPRTRANERELKCAGRVKTGPQLFLTTLLHMGTGLPWDFRLGPGTDSERRHLEDMLPRLPRRALVVADAGFTGYELFRRLRAAGQSFLVRVGGGVHLLKGLGYYQREGADTVYLWPTKEAHQPPLTLRLLVRGRGRKKVYLVTDVLAKGALSDRSAGVLYEMRWGVEVFYRSLKQTLARRRLLSRRPEAAACELTWAVYGLWLLGLMSVSRIVARGGDPLRWSVAAARDRVREGLRQALRGRQDRSLPRDLGRAVTDDYRRRGPKAARDWPHKKNDGPPGAPKLRSATAEQRRAAKRLQAGKSVT